MSPLESLLRAGWLVELQQASSVRAGGRHPRGMLIAYGQGDGIDEALANLWEDAQRVRGMADKAHREDCRAHGVTP